MSSSTHEIGRSSDDPFHQSLSLRVRLGSAKYCEQLCLPVLRDSEDRLTPICIDYIKATFSSIDASSRHLKNNKTVPSSSIPDPSLPSSIHDKIHADDCWLDFGHDTPIEEDNIPDDFNYGTHLDHESPTLSPSEAFIFLESHVATSSTLEWDQALEQATSISGDHAQRMTLWLSKKTSRQLPRPSSTPPMPPRRNLPSLSTA
ncbi:hypothetical protein SMACR_00059 [Sordaria macrospora]|uniref:WGS project CABT00000000 data, contig 2.1 n=2 Tax=Sordaria macrospora TaxID=5147 RepID=F7VK16_SORMK|nr:uncharacterized protein SMAC_00059 [Sordaria macrospora k-hell]KAA8624152.1 hypothetical protein SMACR_00059 [Sordaria macrospora]KAH7631521.1 hypothetical protein B0T09DRAFT_396846 [Sordaria sp. MPI-SDFR-AT-0083]WPJ62842.1 hypothetical protein SMAC4_00059 [Sordaria macrospora]CCC05843.1 unnamed protein product [Sordaria macrospora k-hell]